MMAPPVPSTTHINRRNPRSLQSNEWYEDFFHRFPREKAVRSATEQWWLHEPGCEYLAANPVDIPGLPGLIQGQMHARINVNEPAIPTSHTLYQRARNASAEDAEPEPKHPPLDPFAQLPEELRLMIIDYLPSRDIANLRLASRICLEIPRVIFRRLMLQDLPWFWEAEGLPLGQTDWYQLYTRVKFSWVNLKGLRNRKRVWKDVEYIVRQMEPFVRQV